MRRAFYALTGLMYLVSVCCLASRQSGTGVCLMLGVISAVLALTWENKPR